MLAWVTITLRHIQQIKTTSWVRVQTFFLGPTKQSTRFLKTCWEHTENEKLTCSGSRSSGAGHGVFYFVSLWNRCADGIMMQSRGSAQREGEVIYYRCGYQWTLGFLPTPKTVQCVSQHTLLFSLCLLIVLNPYAERVAVRAPIKTLCSLCEM